MKPFTVIAVHAKEDGRNEYGPTFSYEPVYGPEVHCIDRIDKARDTILVELCRKNEALDPTNIEVYFQPFSTIKNMDRSY